MSNGSGQRPGRQGFREVQLTNPAGYQPPQGPGRGQTPQQGAAASQGYASNGGYSRHMDSQQLMPNPQGQVPANQRPALGADMSRSTAERHALIGRMQRERTMTTAFEQPQYSPNTDLVFETFYHRNGDTYTCMYKNRERFIIDEGTQQARPFPKQWLDEGILVTDQVVSSSANAVTNGSAAPASLQGLDALADDRAGYIQHPTKGRLQTYIASEKRNVHRYFDKEAGEWVALPVTWELHSNTVKALLAQIKEALPDWDDQCDMLASLRANNYSAEDCIGSYFTIGDVNSLPSARNSKDAKILAQKEASIRELSEQIKQLMDKDKLSTAALQQEIALRKKAETNEHKSQDRSAMLTAQLAQATASLSSMQREKSSVAPKAARGSAVDRATVAAVAGQTQLLHRDHVTLRQQVVSAFTDLQQMHIQLTRSIAQVGHADVGAAAELTELRELYRREALQRKLLYNQLQELRGNIRVFCRCRHDNRAPCCLQFSSDTDVLPPGAKKAFQFDKVFSPQSTQEQVYADTQPIITSCVDGYNVCILAYGQTGSGKTYTMQGPPNDPGVNVRSIMDLLHICQTRPNVDYTLSASMVEIYNETVHDLLSPSLQQLEIRAQGSRVQLPGMVELGVGSVEDVEQILRAGSKNRATAATKMNSTSSRSHLVFMITVKGRDRATGSVSTGSLTLCDLAGSERVGKSEATGQRLVEAASINKSLSALGQVFTALRTGQLHIPYRNSKLTHILQPSLGGDAKACLFVMTSPDASNLSETMSTLQFGSNAQQVALGQAKKNVTRGQPDM